jgi:hypothetical protein
LVAFLLVLLFGIPIGLYLVYRAVKEGLEGVANTQEGLSDSREAELELRVAELEERLDFAERVLAERTAGRLEG